MTTIFSLNDSPALGHLSLWTDLKKDSLKLGWIHLLSRRPQPLSMSIKRPFKSQITFSLLLLFSTKMIEKPNR